MYDRNPFRWALLIALTATLVSSARGQEQSMQTPGKNQAEMTFVSFPGMPTCATGAVQSGDPATGPSIILAKLGAGCSIPWHWHTPNEHLMMVTGVGNLEMKDGKPVALRVGAFALMPAHHVHRFRCSGQCTLFLYSDVAYDMHYVDAQGTELSPEAALKAVGETAAAAPAAK
jgi:quercetin dioxygenase-like cupin family protein